MIRFHLSPHFPILVPILVQPLHCCTAEQPTHPWTRPDVKGRRSLTMTESLSRTAASKPNHSFLTFVALITLNSSCQAFDSVWHDVLITPNGTLQYHELLMRKWLDKTQMTGLFKLGHALFLMRFALRRPARRENCITCPVKTIKSHCSRCVTAHLQRVKCYQLCVCVFRNELWGRSKQFIRWNLDPVSLITAMMV